MIMEEVLNFLVENWETTAGFLLLVAFRIWPTDKDRDVILMVKKILDYIIPNLKKGGGTHKTLMITLLMVSFVSMSCQAQVNGNFKTIRLVNVNSVSDTANVLPINATIYYNEVTDKLMAYEGGRWKELIQPGGGGGGGITNSAANNEIMKSDGTNAVGSSLFMSGNTLSKDGLFALRSNDDDVRIFSSDDIILISDRDIYMQPDQDFITQTPGINNFVSTGNGSLTSTNGNVNLSAQNGGNVRIQSINYPNTDGTNGQVLTTDGSGNLSFTTVGGGGGITNSAANNEMMKSDGTNAVGSGFFQSVSNTLSVNSGNFNISAPDTIILNNFWRFEENYLVSDNSDQMVLVGANSTDSGANGSLELSNDNVLINAPDDIELSGRVIIDPAKLPNVSQKDSLPIGAIYDSLGFIKYKKTAALVYDAFFPIPTKSADTTEINYASNGAFLQQSEMQGNTDIVINSDYLRMDFAGFAGTSSDPYRIFLNGYTVGGNGITAGQKILSVERSGNDFFEFYNGRILGEPTETLTGIIGVASGSSPSTGTTFKFQRLFIEDIWFSGFQSNVARPNEINEKLEFYNVYVSGYDDEGEGFYIMNTSKPTGYNPLHNLIMEDCAVYNKGRDGLQINSTYPINASDSGVYITNVTIYDVGKANTSGQWFSLQAQNVNGTIKNSIFDTAGGAAIIAANGLTFENCYFNLTNDRAILIQDLETQYGSSAPALNNQPIRFVNCYFDGDGVTITDLFDINENNADIEFVNCNFDNISTVFVDNRTDKITYSITNTNPTYDSTPSPAYSSWDIQNENDFGLVISQFHYNLGMGNRTPNI